MRRALGLIELLTIVAILAIGLAFMVSMARHVRSTSANELTRKRMAALIGATKQLAANGTDPTLSLPIRLREDGRPERRGKPELPTEPAQLEAILRAFARDSSQHLADLLIASQKKSTAGLSVGDVAKGLVGASLPDANDAWGNPIALMPGQNPYVGMAPNDGPFFVSAGPDGRFLTLADNLYSYDRPEVLDAPITVGTNTAPAGTSDESETSVSSIKSDP